MDQARQSGTEFGSITVAFGAFWAWWQTELAAAVPASWRVRLRAASMVPVLRVRPSAYLIERPAYERGRLVFRPLAEVPREAGGTGIGDAAGAAALESLRAAGAGRRPRLAVALPRGMALTRTLTLPAAVGENLREAIEFELDRLTPFRPDQIYFDARVVARNPRAKECTVALAYAQRSVVDDVVDRLARRGVEVASIVPEGEETSGLDLLPDLPARTRSRTATAGWVIPWLLAALLGAAAVGLPIWQKREQVIALAAQVDQARQQAQATDVLRKQVEELEGRYNLLLGRKYAYPPMVQVLEEVTRLFPDDTWISQLDIRTTGRGKDTQREVQMRGDTANAGRLISLLEESTVITEAAPRSPTLKLQPGPGEAFDLGAKVKPLSPPPPVRLPLPADAAASPPGAGSETQPSAGASSAPSSPGPSAGAAIAPAPPAVPAAAPVPAAASAPAAAPAPAAPASPAPSASDASGAGSQSRGAR